MCFCRQASRGRDAKLSKCKKRGGVQGIRGLIAAAGSLVSAGPAGSLWVGEHKWRCVWGDVAAGVRVTATVGNKARAVRRRLALAVERTRKGYLLHHPLLLCWDRLCRGLWNRDVVVGRVGGRQVERVLLHSQAHHGDGRRLWGGLLHLRRRLVLIGNFAAGLMSDQDELQAFLLLLQLGYFCLQLSLLLLQHVCLLRLERQEEDTRGQRLYDHKKWEQFLFKIWTYN